uniref:Peptidase S8/S53 domain-containing protein n=1 Tax=blood disease bacterium R229 TaxID=741978 RepID=G2ZMM7_9RALS|nr:hypothetical protein BDB_80549 [blood disease bacterium R229]
MARTKVAPSPRSSTTWPRARTSSSIPGTGGLAEFAQGIETLALPKDKTNAKGVAGGGAQVIIDDLQYLYEPAFQSGIVGAAIDNVVKNHGIAYFSAGGNDGAGASPVSYLNNAPRFADQPIDPNGTGVRPSAELRPLGRQPGVRDSSAYGTQDHRLLPVQPPALLGPAVRQQRQLAPGVPGRQERQAVQRHARRRAVPQLHRRIGDRPAGHCVGDAAGDRGGSHLADSTGGWRCAAADSFADQPGRHRPVRYGGRSHVRARPFAQRDHNRRGQLPVDADVRSDAQDRAAGALLLARRWPDAVRQ